MKMKALRLALVLAILCGILAGCSSQSSERRITVGAKDFTEQDILGNIVTLLIENNSDIKVNYVNEMASNVLFAALQSGDVDICVDYTGTVYGNYLGHSEIKSAGEVYDISVKELDERFGLSMLSPIGFNNTYCLAVRPDTAAEHGLRTYSDLAKVSSEFIFGGGFEILNRNDGMPNLKIMYNMEFKEERAVEGVMRYSAIASNETQVTEAFSTDGMLLEFDLIVLEDDKNFFPPYYAAPIIRSDTAEEYPELEEVLGKLTGALNDDSMRELNYRVDVLKENPRTVAEEFLKASRLI